MKEYICESCDFISKNKTNYTNHLQTQTHIKNITPENKTCCNKCFKIFSHKNSLYKHKKTCNNININNDNDNILDDPNVKILLLKQELKFKETEKKLLKEKTKIESKLLKEKTEKELLKEFEKEKTKLIKENNKKLLKTKDEQIDLIQKNNLDSIKNAYSEGKMNALTFVSVRFNKTPKMPALE